MRSYEKDGWRKNEEENEERMRKKKEMKGRREN